MKLDLGRSELAPLTAVIDALDKANAKEHSALELTALFKRVESMMDGLRQRIKKEANKEFLELASKNPKLNTWPFLQGIVQLSRYTQKGYWNYPMEVIHLENEWRSAQKRSQMDGTAKKSMPNVDTSTDTIFSLTVSEDYNRVK